MRLVALVLAASLPAATAWAQPEPHHSAPEVDPWGGLRAYPEEHLGNEGGGACGGDLRGRTPLRIANEQDGSYFRGLGAPGRDLTLGLDLGFSNLGTVRPGQAFGGAASVRVEAVLFNLLERTCIVGGAHGGVPFVEFPDRFQFGNLIMSLGLLHRHPYDVIRLRIDFDFALPAPVNRRDAERQTFMFNVAATYGVEDELLFLPSLRWGGRVRAHLRAGLVSTDQAGFGIYLELDGRAGSGRIRTLTGFAQGALAGLRMRLSFEGQRLPPSGGANQLGVRRRVSLGIRGGLEGAISVSSLWPTDVLFPVRFGGFFGLAFTGPHRRVVNIEVYGGATYLDYLLPANAEGYVQGLLRMWVAFDTRVRPLTRITRTH